VKPRIFVSLELLPKLAALVPSLDDLDIAYACSKAGADGIIVGVPAEIGSRDSLNRFDRPGLPLLCVHASLHQLDSLSALGSAPDRFLISDDGRPCSKLDAVAELQVRISGTHQEIAALIQPEPQMIKLAARARIHWVAFSTETLQKAETRVEAEQELARLTGASVLASRNKLRVMIYGAMDRHLAPSVAELEGVEELAPTVTLWSLALRHGWEHAIETFYRWIR
jgi:hypothetical protein